MLRDMCYVAEKLRRYSGLRSLAVCVWTFWVKKLSRQDEGRLEETSQKLVTELNSHTDAEEVRITLDALRHWGRCALFLFYYEVYRQEAQACHVFLYQFLTLSRTAYRKRNRKFNITIIWIIYYYLFFFFCMFF